MNYNETKILNYYTIFPSHINRHKTLFGGQTLYWLDEVTGVVIRRYSNLPFFTASIDSYQFLDVVYDHESLMIETYISRVGNRSVEVFAELSAFNYTTRETRLVGICFMTFALNKSVELKEGLPQLEYDDEISKFVNGSFEKRKNNELGIREFCKLYGEYYDKKDFNKGRTL